MTKLQLISIAGAAMLSLCGTAQAATTFTGSYTVTSNGSDPGLVVHTEDILSDPFSIDLEVGVAETYELFLIWTDETAVNLDDLSAKDITVTFTFTDPESMGGDVEGKTRGGTIVIVDWGQVTWDGPLTLTYGASNDGILEISLSDEVFNAGWIDLKEGKEHGVAVEATFLLKQEATPAPEPATALLLGIGLAGLAARKRRA